MHVAPDVFFPRKTQLLAVDDRPADYDAKCFESRSDAQLADPAHWAALCPELHISDSPPSSLSNELLTVAVDPSVKSMLPEMRERIGTEGFVSLPPMLFASADLAALAQCAVRLLRYGYPPSFLYMYDELWHMAHEVAKVLRALTHNEPNLDYLAWYVNPSLGQAGFSPHRDRQPADVQSSFHADGMPKYCTCWLPLTDACPENSCLYVLPANADPGYWAGDDHSSELDPLQTALQNKESYQNVRALPAARGSPLLFSHRLIHWGSRGRAGFHTPRIAVSFVSAHSSFEPAYLPAELLPLPPPLLRLRLVCGQMLVYHERFQFDYKDVLRFYRIFMGEEQPDSQQPFHSSYLAKVKLEFVSAVKDVEQRLEAKKATQAEEEEACTVAGNGDQDMDSDEAMDAALDAMLDAEMDGEAAFEDDFDLVCGDDFGYAEGADGDDSDDDDDELQEMDMTEEELAFFHKTKRRKTSE